MAKTIKISPYDTPWEIACQLINAKYEHENMLGQKVISNCFDINELRRIGQHLVNYSETEGKKNDIT